MTYSIAEIRKKFQEGRPIWRARITGRQTDRPLLIKPPEKGILAGNRYIGKGLDESIAYFLPDSYMAKGRGAQPWLDGAELIIGDGWCFADTEEECRESFGKLVDTRIQKLQGLIRTLECIKEGRP